MARVVRPPGVRSRGTFEIGASKTIACPGLDQLGVRCVLFNTDTTTRWHPKGSTEGSRTMEHFRRLGIAGHHE